MPVDNETAMIAQVALRKMLRETHFSICTIDTIGRMIGAPCSGAAYRKLHTLHCVDYRDMPEELLRRLPDLIAEVLRFEPVEMADLFAAARRPTAPARGPIIDHAPPEKKRSGFALLRFGS